MLRRQVLFFFLLSTLFVVTACSPGVSVDSLMEKSATAEPPRAVRVTVEGTWSSPKLGTPPMPYSGEYTIDFEGGRAHWTIQPPMMPAMVMAYDGNTSWGAWMAPVARYAGWMDQMAGENATEGRMMFAPASAGKESFTLVSAEPEGDPPAWPLTYAPPSGGEWAVWIDDAGLVVRVEHEYRFMDGEPMQGRWTRSAPRTFGDRSVTTDVLFEGTRGDDVLERIEEKVTDVEWNPELSDESFAFPGPGIALDEIGVKTVPAADVVWLTHVGPYDAIGPAIDRLLDGVMQAGLMPMGPVCGTYLNDPGTVAADRLETRLSVPVMVTGEPPALAEGLTFEQRPETRVAFAWHRGEFAGEGEAHARLMAWVANEKKKPAGPPRSLWYHDPEITVAEDMITEVQVPLR